MENICLIDVKNYDDFRKISAKARGKKIVVAKDDVFNRKVLESGNLDVLFNLELGNRKDKLKMRDSGLNHVLCKIARDKKVNIGIDFNEIEKFNPEYLSRLIQNIKLCKKYYVGMILINCCEKDKNNLRALMLSLGMSTSMAKYSVENCIDLN